MRTLIVGGGAIGQFFAAHLAQAAHEVVVLARAREAEALNAAGVSLHCGGRMQQFAVAAVTSQGDPLLDGSFELVIVAVKAYSTGEAGALIAALQSCRSASVLTVQNGVGNEEQLAQALGADRIVAGALTVAVDRVDTAIVAATSRGGLSVAPMGGGSHNWLIAALSAGGLTVQASPDWRSLKWSKLCINILGNAVCAALDWLPSQVYSDRTAFAFERACLLETLAVMNALGIRPMNLIDYPAAVLARAASMLPPSVLRLTLSGRVSGARGGKLPSLLADLRARRPRSEVTALNGAVASHAAAAGAAAPSNERISSVVAGIASGRLRWDDYRGKPQAL